MMSGPGYPSEPPRRRAKRASVCAAWGLALALVLTPSSLGAVVHRARQADPNWFTQKLSVLSEDMFKTAQAEPATQLIGKRDCEFAQSLIRNFSRPRSGLIFEASCVPMADVGEYLLKTEVRIERKRKTSGFQKLRSKVRYRNVASAQYAARILKQLNFHKCNVLIDAVLVGKEVTVETVALIGPPPAKKATPPQLKLTRR